jgi:hypothetical protein
VVRDNDELSEAASNSGDAVVESDVLEGESVSKKDSLVASAVDVSVTVARE